MKNIDNTNKQRISNLKSLLDNWKETEKIKLRNNTKSQRRKRKTARLMKINLSREHVQMMQLLESLENKKYNQQTK